MSILVWLMHRNSILSVCGGPYLAIGSDKNDNHFLFKLFSICMQVLLILYENTHIKQFDYLSGENILRKSNKLISDILHREYCTCLYSKLCVNSILIIKKEFQTNKNKSKRKWGSNIIFEVHMSVVCVLNVFNEASRLTIYNFTSWMRG